MDLFAPHAADLARSILLYGGPCAVIALCYKRRAIADAIGEGFREGATNLGLAIVNGVLLAPLFALCDALVRGSIAAPPGMTELWAGLHPAAVFAAAFLVGEFAVYWRHRFEHSALLWPLHAVHHADTQLQWLSVLRKHPLAKLLSVAVDGCLLWALGLPFWAIGAALILRSLWGFFIHCDVPWTLGTAGGWLMSPAAHRLHHIRDEAAMGHNFGNTITLWDRMFGTYLDPAPYVGCETGIAEGTRGLVGELLRPFEERYWRRNAGSRSDREAPGLKV